jgi:hypothetical protein
MRALKRWQVTPALDTNAYAAGDQVSAIQQAQVCDPIFGGELMTVTVLDKAAQKSALDIFFFDRSVTVAADNAAASFSDADMEFCLGVINVLAADYDDSAANSIATVNPNPILPLVPKNHGRNVYFAIVSRGTPTYAAGSLVLSFVTISGGE